MYFEIKIKDVKIHLTIILSDKTNPTWPVN